MKLKKIVAAIASIYGWTPLASYTGYFEVKRGAYVGGGGG